MDIATTLREKVEALQTDLLAKVEANLSGEILQTRSGTLKASIRAEITSEGDSLAASITSSGVPYAAIQEFGGTTPPHLIVPVKAQALALANGTFAKRINHPGSTIPAHAYLGGALDAMRDDITGDLKEAVLTALGAA